MYHATKKKKKQSERINHEKLIVDWISLFVRIILFDMIL